jgi:predicted permease
MEWVDRWLRRIRYWLERSDEERALDEEMRFHVDMEARALVEEGMDPDEARREARVRFGGVDRYREEVRHARGTGWLEDLASDVRFALRSFRRAPVFTGFALLVLALGIGATTAVASVAYGVLARPLPYPEADQLVRFWAAIPTRGVERTSLSAPDVRDWQERTTALSHVAGYTTLPSTLTLIGEGPAEEIPTAWIVGDYFGVMGTPALLGRTLRPDEYGGADRVVVFSHDYWLRRFGGDPSVVGRTLTIDHQPYEVVGVMPPHFRAPNPDVDAWVHLSVVPQNAIPHELRFVRFLQGVGRLAPGIEPARAQDELTAIAASLAEAYPDENAERTGATVTPLHDVVVGDVRSALAVTAGAVALLLLMACATVAGLLLARAADRRSELAVRMSLGAGRGRVLRQLLAEGLVLGGVGGAAGLVLAWSGIDALARSGTDLLPRSAELGLDPWMLLFAVGATAATILVSALAPARQLGSDDLESGLRSTDRAGRSGAGVSLRRVLVAGEVAVAVLLSVGAALLARSLAQLERVDLGFDPENAVAMVMTIAQEKYPTRADYLAFYRAITERIGSVPGVESVGSVRRLPTRGGGETQAFAVPGLYEPGPGDEPAVEIIHVGGDAFGALGTRVLAGRTFDERDHADAPFRIVVNRSFAARYLNGADAVGRPVRFGELEAEIVGVVDDIRHRDPADPAEPVAYVHQEQNPRIAMAYVVRVRPGTPIAPVMAAMRARVAELDGEQPISDLLPLEAAVGDALARPRALTLLLGGFAVVAAVLAALGVYGVIATLVRARTRELGLRMALGAREGDVMGMVVRQGMAPALTGVVLGLGGALGLVRLLEGLLYGVSPFDVWAFLAGGGVLFALALLACIAPARRAGRLQPAAVLRAD